MNCSLFSFHTTYSDSSPELCTAELSCTSSICYCPFSTVLAL